MILCIYRDGKQIELIDKGIDGYSYSLYPVEMGGDMVRTDFVGKVYIKD
jgi:hypothetical protein